MFIDASALTSLLTAEEDAERLLSRLKTYELRMTSPIAVWETTVAVARKMALNTADVRRDVLDYLSEAGIAIIPITTEAGLLAVDAFERFGKGRHPAALNMGDCFAYACARLHRMPLLYKGSDFALTDIDSA